MSADDDLEDTSPNQIQPYQAVLDSLDETGLKQKVEAISHAKRDSKSMESAETDLNHSTSGIDLRSASFDSLFRVISEEYNEQDVAQVTKSVFNDAFHDLRKFESQKSQLNLIFELIGSPKYDEMHHLDLKTKTMLMSMPKKKPKVSDYVFCLLVQMRLTCRFSFKGFQCFIS